MSNKLSRKQLYDYRDPTYQERLLMAASRHLWLRLKRLRANSGRTHDEERAIEEALEIIWQSKREVKDEIQRKSSEAFAARKPFALRITIGESF